MIWKIPKEGKMRVPGRVYASEELLEQIEQDKTLEQIKNVAHLPGIQRFSIAMPDAHQGYISLSYGVAEAKGFLLVGSRLWTGKKAG